MIHHSPHLIPFELPLTFQACRVKANGQDEEKELTTPDRNLTHMDPFFERRLMRVLRALEEDGYVPVVLEGYRSPQRQHALRTSAKGQAMTRADACQSYHQLGLASDIAFLHRGRLSLDLHQQWAREAYHTLGHVAEANGLRWGGHWNDFGHLELTLEGKRLAMLQDALSSGAEPLARITSHPDEGDQQ